jgi:proteic killer suppression protein
VIRSFRHKGLKKLFEIGDSSKIKQDHGKRLRIILTFLNEAHVLEDINFPGSDSHQLKGDKEGFWTVKVSGNWQVIFRFEDGDAYDVDYLDYH